MRRREPCCLSEVLLKPERPPPRLMFDATARLVPKSADDAGSSLATGLLRAAVGLARSGLTNARGGADASDDPVTAPAGAPSDPQPSEVSKRANSEAERAMGRDNPGSPAVQRSSSRRRQVRCTEHPIRSKPHLGP